MSEVCGFAPEIAGGLTPKHTIKISFPDVFPGFTLEGKFDGAILLYFKCGADGKFSGEKDCKAVICPNIPTIKAAEVDIHVQRWTTRHFGDFKL